MFLLFDGAGVVEGVVIQGYLTSRDVTMQKLRLCHVTSQYKLRVVHRVVLAQVCMRDFFTRINSPHRAGVTVLFALAFAARSRIAPSFQL